MRTSHSIGALAVAAVLGLGVSGTLTAPTAAARVAPAARSASGAPGVSTVVQRAIPACTAEALLVRKGRLEGAAGSRFQRVRVTNQIEQPCTTPGWTRYRFARHGHAIGYRSGPNPGEGSNPPPLVIDGGVTVKSVLSWVGPGAVPRAKCHPRTATAVRVRIRDIPGFFRLPIKARVCTTRQYRPHGTRLGDTS
jgi:hypothetical protein